MNCVVHMSSVRVMDLDRDDMRAWLRAVLLHLGWTGLDLSRRIGVAPSTVNRFLNDPEATHRLSPKTLRQIAQVTGFEPMAMPGHAGGRLEEPDAAPYIAGPASDQRLSTAVAAATAGRNAVDPWVLKTRALEAAGYVPGDVLIVDLNARPEPNDIVCAQVYDWRRGRAETVFRIYSKPYLVAASSDPAHLKPLVVDGDGVVIKGVVIQSIRGRRAAA